MQGTKTQFRAHIIKKWPSLEKSRPLYILYRRSHGPRYNLDLMAVTWTLIARTSRSKLISWWPLKRSFFRIVLSRSFYVNYSDASTNDDFVTVAECIFLEKYKIIFRFCNSYVLLSYFYFYVSDCLRTYN